MNSLGTVENRIFCNLFNSPLRFLSFAGPLNNIHIKKKDIIIRNEDDTKNSLRQNNSKQISVHNMRNALWKRP